MKSSRVLAAAAFAALSFTAAPSRADDLGAAQGMKDGKIVFDITNGDGKSLLDRLHAVDGTRKELVDAGITPHFVVSFRGGATALVQKDASKAKPEDRPFMPQIAAMLAEMGQSGGYAAVEQCGAAVKKHGTDPKLVVPPIKVVQNSFISLMAYQAKGYAYIRP